MDNISNTNLNASMSYNNEKLTGRRIGNFIRYRGELPGYRNTLGEIVSEKPTTDGEIAYTLKVKIINQEEKEIFAYSHEVSDAPLNEHILEKIGFRKEDKGEYKYRIGTENITLINTSMVATEDNDAAANLSYRGWRVVLASRISYPVKTSEMDSQTMLLPSLHSLQNFLADQYGYRLTLDQFIDQ